MKKVFLGIAIVLLAAFLLKTTCMPEEKYYVKLMNSNNKSTIKNKGLRNAVDFTEDNNGNTYVAFKNKIQFINSKGYSYDIINRKELNIYSIEFYNNKIYYSSNNDVYCYDLKNKTIEKLIDNIPNYGDYKEIYIKIYNGKLYASIGAATNSGVVGKDNRWLKDNPFIYDLTPNPLKLKGQNFNSNKTGAFTKYNTTNVKNQTITSHFPGNSSIVAVELKNKTAKTYAYGIRNIKGMDVTSYGKLFVTVGGIENRGLRPVDGDSDYIYNIEENNWYGFPDYSGGDALDSPRFTKKASPILEKEPSINPPAPIYESKEVSTLSNLAIDKEGSIGEKNSIYFYNKADETVYFIDTQGVARKFLSFAKSSEIKSIKFYNSSLIYLDTKEGIIGYIENKNKEEGINFEMIYIFFLGVTISIVSILIFEKIKINKTR